MVRYQVRLKNDIQQSHESVLVGTSTTIADNRNSPPDYLVGEEFGMTKSTVIPGMAQIAKENPMGYRQVMETANNKLNEKGNEKMETETIRQLIIPDDDVRAICKDLKHSPDLIANTRSALVGVEAIIGNLKMQITDAKAEVATIEAETKHIISLEKDDNGKDLYKNEGQREGEKKDRLKTNKVYQSQCQVVRDLEKSKLDADLTASEKANDVKYAIDRFSSTKVVAELITGLARESVDFRSLRHALNQLTKTQKEIYHVQN